MKTPSSLALLLLFAALPAAADPASGARCDVKWLEESQAILSQPGRTVVDGRVKVEGNAVRLVFGDPKTCDAATWRHLAVESPVGDDFTLDQRTGKPVNGTYLRWNNPAAGDFWKNATAAQQIGLLLAVNDFYAAVDAKAASVNAAGDAVLDAAKSLGLADYASSDKSLAQLAVGASGGASGAIKPRLAKIDKIVPATLPPDQLGPTMRKLVVDGGGLGDAVIAFRVAVLELQAELGRQSRSVANLKKRVSGAPDSLRDFTLGVPKDFSPVAADPTVAKDAEKYTKALAAIAGKEPRTEFKDQGLTKEALLDSVDLGVRNLVAIRSAEVDKIHLLAKKNLGEKTIAQFEAGARASAVGAQAPNPLAAATFKAMAGTAEYSKLDMLYENNKARQGDAWVNSKEGKEMAAAREELKAAAFSAQIETDKDSGRKQVVYTHNGVKTVLSGLVPSSVDATDESRAAAAAIISRSILEGALETAKKDAILAALKGDGQPGVDLPAVKTGTIIAPKDIPPATKKIKDGAAGCDNPKDLVRNDYETYAARQNAAAAEMASGNVRSRNDVEKKRLEQLAAADAVCKQEKAAAAAIKQDYFDDAAVAKGERERAGAAADAKCVAAKQAIEEAAQAKIAAIAAAEKGDRDPAKILAATATDLEAGFAVAIDGSVDALKADYLKAGSLRQKKLAEITGNSPRVAEYTGMYFAEAWPKDPSMKDKKQAAISACAKALGFGDPKGGGKYKTPDNPDNVDKHCKVNEGLLAYIASKKGTNRPAP